MARLLVVSRSMALALRLADSHEVVEHPAEALDTLEPDDRIDVVVLDVGEPATAVSVLDSLRRRGSVVPVLIVSGYQPAWAGLAALDLPGVVVVPLPITRTALLTGIERLESGRRARFGVPVAAPPAPPAPESPTPLPAEAFEPPPAPAAPEQPAADPDPGVAHDDRLGDHAPVEPAPVEPAPVEPAPVEPAPVEPAAVEH
ncbi:MAG: hypothetical protein ACKVZ6_05945, partial [Kineosporiaceae bacterium]